jgi:tetratricopeptide (TPR) repeat protein/predicted Ser/Thr protein kinase
MLHLHTCPHGHQWKVGDETDPGPRSGLSVCPECGALETAQVPETLGSSASTEPTLPPPQRSPAPAQPVPFAPTLATPFRPIGASSDAYPSPAVLNGPAAGSASAADPPATLYADSGTRPPRLEDLPIEDRPTRVGGPTSPASAVPGGPTIPGYQVLSELGRGGMGVVYKAEQIGLNRLVALKMILSGEYAGREDLARFRLEAEAAAKLQHPGIVQVYEIGETDGRPFFCLEFVDGAPLDKKLAGAPQPARQAAELVEKLARAMAYAHERHIIHRDLKPANILVTAAGEPKITDFGLAKRLDAPDLQTQTGSVMGTPGYMAPEQAHGRIKQIGPASDVYSLGAILYETLTGRPPFKGESILDTLDQVRTLEPQPPSRLRPKMPHDLETICLKCLHKEPGKRYPAAGDLADDLRRYLNGEPILARRTPAWERAWKWARRRPAWAALTAAVALFVLLLIGGGYVWAAEEGRLLHVASTERDRANQERDRANRARIDAVQSAEDARQALKEVSVVFAEQHLDRVPGMDYMRLQLLARVRRYYEGFLHAQADDANRRREAGDAYVQVGDLERQLGKYSDAEQSYRGALGYLRKLQDESPNDVRTGHDLAVCLGNFGQLLSATDRPVGAEEALGEAQRLLKPIVKKSNRIEDRMELADVNRSLGELLLGQSNLAQAESLFQEALQIGAAPDGAAYPPKIHLALGRETSDLGAVWAAEGRTQDAERALQQARDLLLALVREDPDQRDYREALANARRQLGDLWRDIRPILAEEEYAESLRLCGRLADNFPGDPTYREELIKGQMSLALLLQASGRPEEAGKTRGDALALAERLHTEFPTDAECQAQVGRIWNDEGIRLHTANQKKGAEVRYDEARCAFERLAVDHPDTPDYQKDLANTLQNLGVLYLTTNRSDDGGKLLERAADLRRRLAVDHPDAPDLQKGLARADLNLGGLWQISGNAPKAEACYREAMDRLGQLVQKYPKVPDYRHLLADVLKNDGILLRATNQGDEADKMGTKAVELLTALKDEQPTVPIYREELAGALSERGIHLASSKKSADAEKAFGQALDIQEKLTADFPKNPAYRQELAIYHTNLGLLYVQGERFNDAEKSYRRAVEVMEDMEKTDPENPVYWNALLPPYANLVSLLTVQDPLSSDLPKLWERRVDLVRKLAAGAPKDAHAQGQAGVTLWDEAKWLRQNRRPEDSRDALKQAVAFQRSALELCAAPLKDPFQRVLCDESLDLAETLLALKDRAGAADAAAELAKAPTAWLDDPKTAERYKDLREKLKN